MYAMPALHQRLRHRRSQVGLLQIALRWCSYHGDVRLHVVGKVACKKHDRNTANACGECFVAEFLTAGILIGDAAIPVRGHGCEGPRSRGALSVKSKRAGSFR